ncbi:MAG: L,D-transpeptidase family protein [Pseudomonadota bacterium]
MSTPRLGVCLSSVLPLSQAEAAIAFNTDYLPTRRDPHAPAAPFFEDGPAAPTLTEGDTAPARGSYLVWPAVPRSIDSTAHAREFQHHRMADLEAPVTVRRLRGLQARYQRLVDAGGWTAIPAGSDVAPGASDDRLTAVRARLALTGDIASPDGEPVLDRTLVDGLAHFQRRVQLPPTGHLDAATLAALNVPAEQRLMSIALSLSRTAALPRDAEQDFVLINIAGYDATYQRGDRVLWSGKTMVGTTRTRTPQLESAIDRLVFNPTWIVPNGIATRSVLPAVIKDPGYLARKNLRVFDMKWQPVDPDTVDWRAVKSSRNRDIYIRQDAGDDNALGKVKFMFPNKHSVFLHDTPSKHLFDEGVRAFSNGCVRLENPMALASAMLDLQGLSGDAMRAHAEATTQPEVIRLERPVPVHMLYLTAELGENGEAVFHADVYDEDTQQAMASL